MARLPRPALAALLALGLAACDSAGADFEIGGTYSGVTEDLRDTDSGTFTTLTLDIPRTASGGSFRFEGRVVETGGFDQVIDLVEGMGTYDHPGVTLTVRGETSRGTVGDGGGTITLVAGPGDAPAVLRRQ